MKTGLIEKISGDADPLFFFNPFRDHSAYLLDKAYT